MYIQFCSSNFLHNISDARVEDVEQGLIRKARRLFLLSMRIKDSVACW